MDFGHVAIATLSLLDNKDAQIKFNELFEELNDKFLVDNFSKSESYKV